MLVSQRWSGVRSGRDPLPPTGITDVISPPSPRDQQAFFLPLCGFHLL